MTTTASTTVFVPVYQGLHDVRRCLDSIVAHAPAMEREFDLLIIDDASPDPEVHQYLLAFERTVTDCHVRLLRNDQNLGFVRTCNRAFAETDSDIVLVNSDTVVTAGWLDRLAEAAGLPDVASVTPLTNFGSICTLPQSIVDAFQLSGSDPRIDECAAFVDAHTIGRRPEIITGVGFCMYMTREALDACGTFDAEVFGQGYGEEVDFCLRASSQGFRHLADDTAFVYHRGGGSFSDSRAAGLARSRELMHARYSFFRATNRAERADDPLELPFTALELGLTARDPRRPHVLQVLHSRPGELGGTEKHLYQLIDGLLDEFDCSVLQPDVTDFLLTTYARLPDGSVSTQEHHVPGGDVTDRDVHDPAAAAALRTTLDLYDFDAVHLQNLVHHSPAPLRVLADFAGPVVCSVRDMYLACPHHWLLHLNQQSCGIPDDLSHCAVCLPETRKLDLEFLESFRATVAASLDTVDHWVFASQSAVDYLLRVYDLPDERIQIIEHGTLVEHRRAVRRVDEARIFDEPLRVAYVGIGWAKKGLPVVNSLAERFDDRSVEFHHFGELRMAVSESIVTHGRYDNAVLPELLERAGIQVLLLPGPFVETFGHVLTESLIAGRPVIGSRDGALGERIREHQVGWAIDTDDLLALERLIDDLDRCRVEVLRATRRATELDLRTVADTVGSYAPLYRSDAPPDAGDPKRTGWDSMRERERFQRELRAMAVVNRRLRAQLAVAPAPTSTDKPTTGGAATAAQVASDRLPPRLAQRARSGRDAARRAKVLVERQGLSGAGRDAARRVKRRVQGSR